MQSATETERIQAACASLGDIEVPRVGMVLGSGLRDFAQAVENPTEVPFHDVAHWPVPRVPGHGATLVLGEVGGTRVACLSGRVHLYEGWRPADVVRPVRTLRLLGVETFVLTNAAGGMAPGFVPGDLMLVRDHINLTGSSPLVGGHEDALGPRFPDQSRVYDPELRELLDRLDPSLREGVYLGLLGPSYETPAEIKAYQGLGAHAVGMSTVHEAMALNAMNSRIAAISLISNLAAGISETPLDHKEVIAAGLGAAKRFTELLRRFCAELPS